VYQEFLNLGAMAPVRFAATLELDGPDDLAIGLGDPQTEAIGQVIKDVLPVAHGGLVAQRRQEANRGTTLHGVLQKVTEIPEGR
jgi:hypothetical protein